MASLTLADKALDDVLWTFKGNKDIFLIEESLNLSIDLVDVGCVVKPEVNIDCDDSSSSNTCLLFSRAFFRFYIISLLSVNLIEFDSLTTLYCPEIICNIWRAWKKLGLSFGFSVNILDKKLVN